MAVLPDDRGNVARNGAVRAARAGERPGLGGAGSGRRRVGVDRELASALPWVPTGPVPRLLPPVVRHAPCAARRRPAHGDSHAAPHLPQLLRAPPARSVRRLQDLRPMTSSRPRRRSVTG